MTEGYSLSMAKGTWKEIKLEGNWYCPVCGEILQVIIGEKISPHGICRDCKKAFVREQEGMNFDGTD